MKVSEVVCNPVSTTCSRNIIGKFVLDKKVMATLPIGTLGYYGWIKKMVVWNGVSWCSNHNSHHVNDGTAELGVFIVAFPEDEFPQIK